LPHDLAQLYRHDQHISILNEGNTGMAHVTELKAI
jgi:hypothetical protein